MTRTPTGDDLAAPPQATSAGLALLAGLAVALSPVLAELASHLRSDPWTAYALVFPLLTADLVRRAAPGTPARAEGAAWIAAAVAGELLCLAAGLPALARLALPLAALGWLRLARGLPRLDALLVAWWLPVPFTLLKHTSPWLERTLYGLAAALVGAPTDHATLRLLEPVDGGLRLAVLASGLSWYASARRRRPLGARLRAAGVAAALGWASQLAAQLVAALLLRLGRATAAREWLTTGAWLATLVVAARWRPRARAGAAS